MKQKKQQDVTLELIYKELVGLKDEFHEFKDEQQAWNKKQEVFNDKVIVRLDNIEKDIATIKSCPTIKRELENL